MALTKITGNEIESSTVISAQSFIVSGISTVGSLSIGNTSVISSNHQLQNISSIDATTTATIESALTNAPITFTDFNATGNSTLGVTSTANLTSQSLSVSGISTFINGPVFIGSATSTGIASQRLQVTGGGYVSGSLGIGTSNPQYKLDVNGTIFGNSTITGTQLISNIATGTAPFAVTSTTQVSNLNVQYLNGYSSDTANTANAIVRRDASGNFSVGTITAAALTVSGDLTVNGTTTTINSTTVTVDDKNIELGSVASPTDVTADGGGITLKGATDKTFNWVSSTAAWTSSEDFNLATGKVYEIAGTTVLSASQVLGKSMPSGSVVGTADTQTLTNKTIAAGSNTISGLTNSNLSGTAGITNANLANYTISGVALGSNLSTLTMGVSGTGLSGSTTYNGSGAATFTVASNATSANTVSTIVARDASGNFSAGTITASFTGNVSGSSGSVANAATFNSGGAGAASGTTFNGSAAQTISYNTIGASPLAGSSSLTTTGTVTSGTWSGSFGAVSGANLTGLTAGNLSGTIPSGVLGNSTHYIGTTAIALNRASASQSLTGINIDGSSGSCTGNAATATSSPLLSALGNYVWSASTLPTSFGFGITNSFVQGSDGWQSYGSVMTMKTYSGGGGSLQLFVPYSPSFGGTGLQVRFGNYDVSSGNSWTSWKILLASDNYTSYVGNGTLTLAVSGTGLSGSASFTANQSGATTFTVTSNATSANTGSAIVARDSNGDFSGRYISSSYFNSSDDVSAGTLTYLMGKFGDNYYRSATAAKVATFISGQTMNISGSSTSCSGNSATATTATNQSGGTVSATTGSFSSTLNASGVIRLNSDSSYMLGSPSHGYRFNNSADTINALVVNNSGQCTAYADFRAPIFYDSNNTGYYTDPASTTNLNTLLAQDFKTIFISGAGGHSFAANHYSMGKDIANSSWSHPHYSDLIIGYHTGIRLGAAYSGIRFYGNSPTTDANNDGNGDGGEALLMTVGGYVGTANHTDVMVNNNLFANVSMRSPIFYDSQNTAYYLDPNSTSYLYHLQLSGASYFRPSTWIQMDGSYGMYWPNTNGAHIHGNDLSTYGSIAIRGTRNGWKGIHFYEGGNTPHLMFDGSANGGIYYETGGRWAQYYSYANNCWGFGTSSTSSAYNIYCPTGVYSGGRVDGTVFYDSSNTAYYTDPASTSNLNGLTANSTFTVNNGWSYVANNYGYGIVGLYHASYFQLVFAMGDAYKTTAAGGINNLYGIAWSHPNAGGIAANLNNHGMIVAINGGYAAAISSSIRCATDMRTPIYYDSDNTGYYTDPASTSNLNNVQVVTFGVGTAASGTTGEIRATNNVTAYYSDERLKENITTISSALSKLLTLRGVTFNSNEIAEQYGYTDKKEQVGVIAQDVEKVLPQVVVPAPFDIAQDKDGNEYSKSGENYKTVHYDKLVPLLIEAIKELKGEIEELKLKIPV
jgi:hypothetical protein